MNTCLVSRTGNYGDNANKQYHLGLIDEHYFIIDETKLTSYCLTHYDVIKHINNCNMIYCKISDHYKTSNQKYIDSFKVVKMLLENKDKLLEPIPYDDKIMNTRFYDKVIEYKTLESPESYVKYQHYEPKAENRYYKVYFVFETATHKTHKLYLVRYETEDDERREFIGENCATDMGNNLPFKIFFFTNSA